MRVPAVQYVDPTFPTRTPATQASVSVAANIYCQQFAKQQQQQQLKRHEELQHYGAELNLAQFIAPRSPSGRKTSTGGGNGDYVGCVSTAGKRCEMNSFLF